MSVIQLILLVAFGAAVAATWQRSRQRAISRVETALWTALWLAAAFVVVRPDYASRFASLVGVGRGADAVVYGAIVALFYLVFRVFIRLDKIERDITSLVRRDALAARDGERKERP